MMEKRTRLPATDGRTCCCSKFAGGLVTRSCRRERVKQLLALEMHVPAAGTGDACTNRHTSESLSVTHRLHSHLSRLPASVAGGRCCQVLMHLEHLSS